jgi:hypothetical protein
MKTRSTAVHISIIRASNDASNRLVIDTHKFHGSHRRKP